MVSRSVFLDPRFCCRADCLWIATFLFLISCVLLQLQLQGSWMFYIHNELWRTFDCFTSYQVYFSYAWIWPYSALHFWKEQLFGWLVWIAITRNLQWGGDTVLEQIFTKQILSWHFKNLKTKTTLWIDLICTKIW